MSILTQQQLDYLKLFDKLCAENAHRPSQIANDFVMLGVEDPTAPIDAYSPEFTPDARRVFNKLALEILNKYNLRAKVRKVLLADLHTINKRREDESEEDWLAYGHIARKDWNRQVLDHLLKKEPTPSWVT